MHLPAGDVLLGLGHGAHLEVLWAAGARAHDGGQGHRARLNPPHRVELLLHDRGPSEGRWSKLIGLGGSNPALSLSYEFNRMKMIAILLS